MSQDEQRLVVFIATPLEEVHVRRIRAVAPDRVEVIAEPDLWPPLRYVADHKGVEGFTRTPEQEARWRRHLARADILWDFAPKSSDGTGGMALAPKVRWVQTTSSGVGQLVKELGFQESDLLVTTARGVHAGPLAEFVFMALLMHTKRLRHLDREQQTRHWARYCGPELAGRTLAVIGAGHVGARVAAVGRAFGMRVVASTRHAGPERAAAVDPAADSNPGARGSTRAAALGVDAIYGPDELHDMLRQADAVVLSAPHTPETERLIDRAAIKAMKDGVVFVNIGRGQSVDEEALIAALNGGRIAFAALDVFAVEPLPTDSPLWSMPNVLICPHSASTTDGENGRITDIFCHNLRCCADGRREAMQNILDKRRMY